MNRYAVTLDVSNTRQDFPPATVTLDVSGWDEEDAVKRIGTVYVSADGETVNNTGGVGNGYWYPEWTVADIKLIRKEI